MLKGGRDEGSIGTLPVHGSLITSNLRTVREVEMHYILALDGMDRLAARADVPSTIHG